MLKNFIQNILLITALSFSLYSQDKAPVEDILHSVQPDVTVKRSVVKINPDERSIPPNIELYRYELNMFAPQKSQQDEKFDPVSSFRSNIRFGGFWERYAIVNYTPALNITPFSFMDLSAYHNMSYFVPVKALKEHFKSMAVQSGAVLAIESVFRYIKIFPPMLQQIIAFFCKNAVLQFMQKRVLNEGTDRIFRQVNYYYSMRIRF
jgi:hypothetical protein